MDVKHVLSSGIDAKNRAYNAAHEAGVIIHKLEETSCKIDNLGYFPQEISKQSSWPRIGNTPQRKQSSKVTVCRMQG